MEFVHLHVHSDYSPMEGVASLQALCEAARMQGMDTLAVTDTNGLYGAIRFLQIARETGLRPILGAELRTEPPQPRPLDAETARRAMPRRAVLLVKTQNGYANLCRLLSHRHCDPSFNFISAVAQYRDGLIILSDDMEALAAWKKESRQDLYVELTPGAMMHEALAFSRRSELAPVATNQVRFVHSEQFRVHRLLRAIAMNTTLSRLPRQTCCAPNHWLAPISTLQQYFAHVPHALNNTRRIAQECGTDWDFGRTIFPAFRQLSDENAFARLQTKTYEGARWRYGTISKPVKDRVEYELAIIRGKRFAHYFLVVEEIVRHAPLTCGRGSGAASIVAYCLGITHVDPIKHSLFFERFLNPGRHDPPDIDIDFPWDERDPIVDWVFARYGSERAAMVANQNTLGLRAAIREVAKVYGLAPVEIDRIAPRIFRHIDLMELAESQAARTWAAALCRDMELKAPWPEVLDCAVQVEGHFRHLSLHCGGLVIVPDEIRRYVPVEISAKGVPVIQWEKDQTEEAGLVKIDILGNRSLAVIRDAMAAIEKNTGRHLDYASWDPLSDAVTQAQICKGNTMGCFYIESPATRLLLRKLWTRMPVERRAIADVFEYLVIVSSLVRPAAISFVHEFVRRAHGRSYIPLHPTLETVLAETYGIMVYQEDVTKVAVALAGFSLEDADELRKIISKKHKQRQLRDYCAQFYTGAAAKGASRAAIDTIWAMIMSFAGYSFCKPHSASYAHVSFKSAYLRAHYPAEFMAAVISNEGGFYSTFAYLSEARRMGLTVLPPDINASEWTWAGSGDTLRVGFMHIKGVERAVADKIVSERAGGRFQSFHDFWTRVHPDQAQARILIRAGCFDTVAGELTRPALLWRLHAYREGYPLSLPVPEEYSPGQQLQHEIETFGFPLRQHPLESYRSELQQLECVAAANMSHYIGKEVTMVGWLVSEKLVQTKHGEPMEFVTFEDLTGLYDATLFPDIYRNVCQSLTPDRAYVLRGRIEEDFGAVTFMVVQLECLQHPVYSPAKERTKPLLPRVML